MSGTSMAPAGQRWRDLRTRALSAALLAPVAIGCVWAGGAAWHALVLLALGLLCWEWVRLCGFSIWRLPGMVVPGAVLLAGACAVLGRPLAGVGLVVLGALLAWVLASANRFHGKASPAWLPLAVLEIGLAGIALVHLRADPEAGLANVVVLFLVVWASDIGAYLSGRLLGGPKLAPAISPNKTWSGAMGGLFFAMAVGALAAYSLGEASLLAMVRASVLAGGLGVVSQAGDLFESWMKRRFDVKDSSSLIPGHGGLLDRLDGMLTAAPAAALISLVLGQGGALWR